MNLWHSQTCFFDEYVNRYLSMTLRIGRVFYLLAIGYPVSDPRLEACKSNGRNPGAWK
jgi:hypothetical protein